ncbi:hypothetical protein AC578_10030 [Pseudocercospora eumusae]|uniref:Uncharacterized protein n=1 Tax=Pseudocercospora eumusae TaxID=321146 RepID=A0A139H6N5_9PEZI|nr:hypothetical protein AC578_10030 [Pseudocercospora eumusae]
MASSNAEFDDLHARLSAMSFRSPSPELPKASLSDSRGIRSHTTSSSSQDYEGGSSTPTRYSFMAGGRSPGPAPVIDAEIKPETVSSPPSSPLNMKPLNMKTPRLTDRHVEDSYDYGSEFQRNMAMAKRESLLQTRTDLLAQRSRRQKRVDEAFDNLQAYTAQLKSVSERLNTKIISISAELASFMQRLTLDPFPHKNNDIFLDFSDDDTTNGISGADELSLDDDPNSNRHPQPLSLPHEDPLAPCQECRRQLQSRENAVAEREDRLRTEQDKLRELDMQIYDAQVELQSRQASVKQDEKALRALRLEVENKLRYLDWAAENQNGTTNIDDEHVQQKMAVAEDVLGNANGDNHTEKTRRPSIQDAISRAQVRNAKSRALASVEAYRRTLEHWHDELLAWVGHVKEAALLDQRLLKEKYSRSSALRPGRPGAGVCLADEMDGRGESLSSGSTRV